MAQIGKADVAKIIKETMAIENDKRKVDSFTEIKNLEKSLSALEHVLSPEEYNQISTAIKEGYNNVFAAQEAAEKAKERAKEAAFQKYERAQLHDYVIEAYKKICGMSKEKDNTIIDSNTELGALKDYQAENKNKLGVCDNDFIETKIREAEARLAGKEVEVDDKWGL